MPKSPKMGCPWKHQVKTLGFALLILALTATDLRTAQSEISHLLTLLFCKMFLLSCSNTTLLSLYYSFAFGISFMAWRTPKSPKISSAPPIQTSLAT